MTFKEHFRLKTIEYMTNLIDNANDICTLYNGLPKDFYPRTDMINWLLEEGREEFGEECFCRGSLISWLRGDTKPSDSKHADFISNKTGLSWG